MSKEEGMTWKTSEMERCGQPLWLVKMYELTVKGIRKYGLPSEVSGQVLAVKVPTLMVQADVMRRSPPKAPGKEVGTLII